MNPKIKHFSDHHSLTARENDILGLLANGTASSKQMAKTLDLCLPTINNHISSIFKKTDSRSRGELLSKILRYMLSTEGQNSALQEPIAAQNKPA